LDVGFTLRRTEDGEHSRGTTELKQATAVGRDVLVVAGLEAEEIAEFVIASAEPLRCIEALEAAHTSDAAFHAPMILFQSVMRPVRGWMAGLEFWPFEALDAAGNCKMPHTVGCRT
jgi:hypothetical protein